MTMYEELKKGLQSGIDAYKQGKKMRQTIVTTDDKSKAKGSREQKEKRDDTVMV